MSEGSIEQRDGRVIFRYERQFRHPVDAVWRAITDPAHIERWTGNRPDIDLRPGGRYISYHAGGDRVVDRVTRVEPQRLFEHTFWADLNPSALVTWELSPTEYGCRLELTHSLDLDDVRSAAQKFGDDLSIVLSRNGAGWHHLLDVLNGDLDDRATAWSAGDQKALQERYAGMLQDPV